IEHTVAIVAGKRNGFAVEDAHKSRIAALVGDSWSTLMIDGRQKEHIAAFDECLVLRRDFGEHYARFDIVSNRRVSKRSCNERWVGPYNRLMCHLSAIRSPRRRGRAASAAPRGRVSLVIEVDQI